MNDDADRGELLRALRAGHLLEWNEWRENGETPLVSLAGADLSRLNLRGVNLSEFDLSNANLSGANLYEADLTDADLSGADLSNANLSDAVLTGCDLRGARLDGADLSGANIGDAAFDGTLPPQDAHVIRPSATQVDAVVGAPPYGRAMSKKDGATSIGEITFLFDVGSLTPRDMVEVVRSMSRALGVELEIIAVRPPPADESAFSVTLRKVA
jgi:hypothetical protein